MQARRGLSHCKVRAQPSLFLASSLILFYFLCCKITFRVSFPETLLFISRQLGCICRMSESITTEEELTKLKLGELKKLCKKYNLSTAGTKIDLVSRLVENKETLLFISRQLGCICRMSESITTEEELTKLKLGELKKLCKKYNLSTAGTKIDLVSRLVENKGDTFTVLQPGDEAKLLGDVVDDDSTSYALTDSSALDTLDVTHEDMPVSPDVDQVVLPNQNTLAGSKRSCVVLEDASTAESAVSPSKVPNTHLPTENSTSVTLVNVSPPTQENDVSRTGIYAGFQTSTVHRLNLVLYACVLESPSKCSFLSGNYCFSVSESVTD
ncbi:hypothetical protein AHF37_08641 [Paragonimus kellicotti]|nr:hypothetical protein AHF37_08641 [Paragonimus kellicotti]